MTYMRFWAESAGQILQCEVHPDCEEWAWLNVGRFTCLSVTPFPDVPVVSRDPRTWGRALKPEKAA
jgi:hypothetical protein